MKILLLNPPAPAAGWYQLEHLGLGYIAAVLRQDGHDVVILDANLEGWDADHTSRAAVAQGPYELIGLTAMEPQTFQTGMAIIAALSGPENTPRIIAGGYFATFWGAQIMAAYPAIDAVVLGEGEQTIVELVRAMQNGGPTTGVPGTLYRRDGQVLCAPARPLLADLDRLPFPARDYVRRSYERHHVAGLYGSRGCCHKCTFCQISRFYRLSPGAPYRTRSAANIVAEIEQLRHEHGIHNFLFVDDEFIEGSRRRTAVIRDLCHTIRRRELDVGFAIQYRADHGHQRDLLIALKGVGLSTVFIGVESGIDSVLARYEKGITRRTITTALAVARELELSLIVGYILFDPDTTFDELRANVAYLSSDEAPTVLDLHGMIVLKGTPDEARLRREGRLKEEGFQLLHPAIDADVQAFKHLLAQYYPFSSPAVRDIYRLHLMVGRFAAQDRPPAHHAAAGLLGELRRLHQTFLQRAIDDVTARRDGNGWLDELRAAHGELAQRSSRLVAAWERPLGGR